MIHVVYYLDISEIHSGLNETTSVLIPAKCFGISANNQGQHFFFLGASLHHHIALPIVISIFVNK